MKMNIDNIGVSYQYRYQWFRYFFDILTSLTREYGIDIIDFFSVTKFNIDIISISAKAILTHLYFVLCLLLIRIYMEKVLIETFGLLEFLKYVTAQL